MNKELLEKIIQIISTHSEHDGSYCDTGEDMEWGCRSECMEKAIKRLEDFYGLDRDNPCGKAHNNGRGEDECAECIAIRLNI